MYDQGALTGPFFVIFSLSSGEGSALVDQQCPCCSIPLPISIIVACAFADVLQISEILSFLTTIILSSSFLHEEEAEMIINAIDRTFKPGIKYFLDGCILI